MQHDLRNLKCIPDDGDNYLSAFMFGFVPQKTADYLMQGRVVPFRKGENFMDCLDDIERAKEIIRMLGKDYLVIDFTDSRIKFPVVQVLIPGYSDVLPYYPATSRVLFRKYTRSDVLRSYDSTEAGQRKGRHASGKFGK